MRAPQLRCLHQTPNHPPLVAQRPSISRGKYPALPQRFADRNEVVASDRNPTEGEVGEVQRASRHDLVRALAPRYGHVSKTEKGQILNQVCEVTGYTRKYALTLLREPPDEPAVKRTRRRSPSTTRCSRCPPRCSCETRDVARAPAIFPRTPALLGLTPPGFL